MDDCDLDEQQRRREEALEFLLGRINYERTPVVPYGQRQLKLDRMRQLLTRLGNPDSGMPIVHVAGTKGKGSTSALIASVLREAGFETGLFSSPHLEKIEERFAVNGQPCSGEELVALVEQIRPVVQAMDRESAASGADPSMSPTYFEVTTALALMYFAEREVDVVVLEVGLGGRLDSTNVCQPLVSIITSISFDHTKQLGDTLPEIAAEKAGIIKPGVPVLCGPMDDEPRRTIADVAQQHGCRLIVPGDDYRYQYQPPAAAKGQGETGRIDFQCASAGEEIEWSNLPLRLLGEHQAANAAVALATIAELRRQGWAVSREAIHRGLAKLTLPGRFEVVGQYPPVVLDVAHNVASAQALAETLQANFADREKVLLLAATKDKDVPGIVRALLPSFCRVVVTQYLENPRAVPSSELLRIVQEEVQHWEKLTVPIEISQCTNPQEAVGLARNLAGRDRLICVTGSFFIVAELRGLILADVATVAREIADTCDQSR